MKRQQNLNKSSYIHQRNAINLKEKKSITSEPSCGIFSEFTCEDDTISLQFSNSLTAWIGSGIN
jgi:hypothetical protein